MASPVLDYRQRQEDSSFSEEKEAKRLLSIASVAQFNTLELGHGYK
jgi:hypothetical protein